MRSPIRQQWLGRAFASVILASSVLAAPTALAGWNGSEENIAQHPTWIYTPSSTMANGKRALMLVLHGCAQTNDQLKTAGNLTGVAEAKGMVVAVPDVGSEYFGTAAQRCWDYNGATDSKGHIVELVSLANTLKSRAGLNIDPNHVYITGLSSGGGMAQAVGCKAPDVFAGVGAVAGPSVGSNQNMALQNAPSGAASTHVTTCNQLAGSKSSHFATQIANFAYGNMDKNGSQANCNYPMCSTAGKIALVDVNWATHSANAMRSIYGTGSLGTAAQVPGGGGDHRIASKDGNKRVGLLQIYSVGHAWPAGGGPGSGEWIANFGMNYLSYAADWFIQNNLRDGAGDGRPAVSVNASASGTAINLSGSATDSDGSIVSIGSVLLKKDSGGNFVQQASHSSLGTGPNYSDSYTGLANGIYKVRVTARDNDNQSTTAESGEISVGVPQVACTNHTASNYAHVSAGRATVSWGYAYAKGSGESMGLYNLQITTLREYSNQPGYYRVGACP